MDAESALTPQQNKKKILVAILAGWAVILAILLPTLYVYARPTSDLTRKIVGVLPYPAMIVNGSSVRMEEFLIERDALINYFSLAGAQDTMPTDEELGAQIVDTMVNKEIVSQIAKEQRIALDQGRADEFYAQVTAEAGGEEAFAIQLTQTFGWSPEQFRERVVNSVVLATQVSEWVALDPGLQAEAKAQADQALARLAAGEDFALVASEMSQDFTAAEGGDVGFIPDEQLPPEWGDQVRVLEVGDRTSIIETNDAFLIFKLTDRVTAEEDVQRKLSAIIIPKKTMDDVVKERVEQAKVWRFVGRS